MRELTIKESKQLTFLDAIKSIEDEMLKRGGKREDGFVQHRFADGVYSREYFMPAGQTATSKMHRKANFLVLLTGEVTIWTEDGKKRLKAPQVLLTRPGTKRIVKAHVDSTIIIFQGSFENDLELLEAELMVPSEEEEMFIRRLEVEDTQKYLSNLALLETSRRLLGRNR